MIKEIKEKIVNIHSEMIELMNYMHPYMSSEDFAFMLKKRPGTYCMLGDGDSHMVHHPGYIFDQSVLKIGATYWVGSVQEYLI